MTDVLTFENIYLRHQSARALELGGDKRAQSLLHVPHFILMQYPNGQLIVIAHSKVSSEPTFESQLTAEFPIEHHYRADF